MIGKRKEIDWILFWDLDNRRNPIMSTKRKRNGGGKGGRKGRGGGQGGQGGQRGQRGQGGRKGKGWGRKAKMARMEEMRKASLGEYGTASFGE